jgi:phage terminase large subunit-like protein
MMQWTTACPDWRERILAKQSLVPCKPLFPDQAAAAMEVFNSLKVVDAAGEPTIGQSSLPWVTDFAETIFGAYDAEQGRRLIREFFLLVSKKNSKSTMAAAIMLTALVRNWRKSAEFLIVAPTLEVAQNSFKPAMDMVAADEELSVLLKPNAHYRTIEHRVTGAVLKVLAADKDTVTGKKAAGVLIDELWLFGKRADADSMLREVIGGLVSRPEGFVIYLSTQSDEPPAGTFRTKLNYFREVRDGTVTDPRSLPMIYEFPEPMVASGAYLDPANIYVTNPNLGISVDREWLEDEFRKAEAAGDAELRVHCSKHLNIQIGMALYSDRWIGADFWEDAGDDSITLDALIARCDVAVVGIDGGGLDDLFGMAVIGRDRVNRDWLLWAHAWAQPEVLVQRKIIAGQLRDFEADGDLTMCVDSRQDLHEVADIVERLAKAGLLPEKGAIGLDPLGIAQLVDELASRGITDAQVVGVGQGYRLHGAVTGMARKLKDGTLWHSGSGLMAWCVGNAKVELRGSAELITKQTSGKAKIDPLMAAFDAVALMSRNPEPKQLPQYQMMIFGDDGHVDNNASHRHY